MAEPSMREPLDPKKYYEGIQGHQGSLRDKFNDIDDPAYFRQYMHLLKEAETQNFVLDFGNEDAYCATDLVTEDFKALLSPPVCNDEFRSRAKLTQDSDPNVLAHDGCKIRPRRFPTIY
jgi:hypothetical protein